MKRSRLQVFYSGSVQGVGFRYTVKSVAPGFEVTGTIRNLTDGRVELILEGKPAELEAFQQAVRDSGLGRRCNGSRQVGAKRAASFAVLKLFGNHARCLR